MREHLRRSVRVLCMLAMQGRRIPSLALLPWLGAGLLLVLALVFALTPLLGMTAGVLPAVMVVAALIAGVLALIRTTRTPRRAVAASPIYPGHPFSLYFAGTGLRHCIWLEIDVRTDRTILPGTRELLTDLRVDAAGDPGQAWSIMTARWREGGWKRLAMSADRTVGGVDALYCLDIHIDGDRFRALSALRRIHPAEGAQVIIHGCLRGEPWLRADAVTLFVTQQ